ncbi:5741_t:CDS:1 [Funneliformis geosporum]|uniref:196_t:CDS:1 n=1 Tax=Funneliformis geosporum TaxID=1117311 RepID=A0A9W4SPM3_9GLOM|nr:5741_t:CDS:1 [Funneliformis geosporum]CAI2175979.1 196_t:CDS:1 [Funneliformis geosporum]
MYYFFEPETLSSLDKGPKRRKPNMFIMYRKDMMKHKPHNMPMTKYSKLVSEWWKKLSADEKAQLQRKYQIDRDQKLQKEANARLSATNQSGEKHEINHIIIKDSEKTRKTEINEIKSTKSTDVEKSLTASNSQLCD